MAKVRPPRGARAWKELRSVGTWSREERLRFMIGEEEEMVTASIVFAAVTASIVFAAVTASIPFDGFRSI